MEDMDPMVPMTKVNYNYRNRSNHGCKTQKPKT